MYTIETLLMDRELGRLDSMIAHYAQVQANYLMKATIQITSNEGGKSFRGNKVNSLNGPKILRRTLVTAKQVEKIIAIFVFLLVNLIYVIGLNHCYFCFFTS